MATSGKCYHCNDDLTVLDFGRADTCRNCGKATRVCKNCEHYEVGQHNDCRESQADRVVEKEKANFCDYFKPSNRAGNTQNPTASDLKAKADALFKKKP